MTEPLLLTSVLHLSSLEVPPESLNLAHVSLEGDRWMSVLIDGTAHQSARFINIPEKRYVAIAVLVRYSSERFGLSLSRAQKDVPLGGTACQLLVCPARDVIAIRGAPTDFAL